MQSKECIPADADHEKKRSPICRGQACSAAAACSGAAPRCPLLSTSAPGPCCPDRTSSRHNPGFSARMRPAPPRCYRPTGGGHCLAARVSPHPKPSAPLLMCAPQIPPLVFCSALDWFGLPGGDVGWVWAGGVDVRLHLILVGFTKGPKWFLLCSSLVRSSVLCSVRA